LDEIVSELKRDQLQCVSRGGIPRYRPNQLHDLSEFVL
jgi:hypothetical protein